MTFPAGLWVEAGFSRVSPKGARDRLPTGAFWFLTDGGVRGLLKLLPWGLF